MRGLRLLCAWLMAPGAALAAGPPPPTMLPEMVMLPPMADGKSFAMARTETTFAQWDTCVAAGGCPAVGDDAGWGRGNNPAINVSWNDANSYARWVSSATGRFCRLPTSAEWTFAAHGGNRDPYWWGGTMQPGMARCRGCNPGQPDQGPLPVGSFPPNPYGLYDMNGNVAEWTLDCVARRAGNGCAARATLGGAWTVFALAAQGTAEAPRPPAEREIGVGFRIICEP